MKFLEAITGGMIYLIIGFMVIKNAQVTLNLTEFQTGLSECILGSYVFLNVFAKLNQNK